MATEVKRHRRDKMELGTLSALRINHSNNVHEYKAPLQPLSSLHGKGVTLVSGPFSAV